MPRSLALRVSAIAVLLIIILCSGSSISNQSTYASTSANGGSMTNFLPFLPNFPTSGDGIDEDQRINPTSDTGSLTVKKVKVGSSEQIGNATLMFTPNPYTLRNSLIVTDNSIVDSDPSDGSFQLKQCGLWIVYHKRDYATRRVWPNTVENPCDSSSD